MDEKDIMSNEELAKSLVSLIDETLEEMEELKKSKFSASEIKIEGPGDKDLAGKPVNGELDAKKTDDKDEDDKDEDEDDDKDDKKKPFEKTDDDDKDDKKKDKKVDGVEKGILDEAEKCDTSVKKSNVETDQLMKSYVDSKITPLEAKLSTIVDMLNKMGDKPTPRKSVPAGSIVPLKKNADEGLSKSEIVDKLFELKKSGTNIDSADFVKLDIGSKADVQTVADKYGLR